MSMRSLARAVLRCTVPSFALLASCAHANGGAAPDVVLPHSAAEGAEHNGGAGRAISPMDLLEISVLDAPEFSRTLRVSEKGEISLPLIGVQPAAGRTPHELEAELATRLRASYMIDPQVTVFIKEAAVDPIYVVGEVNQPGAFTPSGSNNLSFLQAVALARGTKPGASQSAVLIRTNADGSRSQIPVRLGDVIKGRSVDPLLQPNDIVYVPTNREKSVALGVVNALVRVVTFRTVF